MSHFRFDPSVDFVTARAYSPDHGMLPDFAGDSSYVEHVYAGIVGPPSTSNGALNGAVLPSAHRTLGSLELADSAPASGRARTGRAIRIPSGCRVGDAPGHRDKARSSSCASRLPPRQRRAARNDREIE